MKQTRVYLVKIYTLFLWVFGLGLLRWSWWRGGTPPAPPTPPLPTPPRLPSTPELKQPSWLQRVEVGQPVSIPIPEFHPTLFIGIGPTGNEVIERIAYNLIEIGNGKRPNHVHLLHIDVVPKDVEVVNPTQKSFLEPNEKIILCPDLEDYHKKIRADSENRYYLAWWGLSRPGQPGQNYDRPAARLGLFHDLAGGTQNSKVWSGLSRNLQTPGTIVWIIASAADLVGSSLAFDIAHLARQTSSTIQTISLALLLHNSSPELNDDSNTQSARVFATCQEILRFQERQPTRFCYKPADTTLDRSSTNIVDTIYLLDSEDGKQAVIALADAVTTLSSRPASTQLAGYIGNLALSGPKAMSLGCASQRIPLKAWQQYLATKLVTELLTEPSIGLIAEQTTYQANVQALAIAWLQGEGQFSVKHPFWKQVAHVAQNDPVTILDNPDNAEIWFKTCLLNQVVAILNGEGDQKINQQGANTFRFITDFCKKLKEMLRVFRARGNQGADIIGNCQKWLDNLSQNLAEWEIYWRKQVRPCRDELTEQTSFLTTQFNLPAQRVPVELSNINNFYNQTLLKDKETLLKNQLLRDIRKRMGWLADPQLKPALLFGIVPLTQPTDNTKWFSLADIINKGQFKTELDSIALEVARRHLHDFALSATRLEDTNELAKWAKWLENASKMLIRTSDHPISQQLFAFAKGTVKAEPSQNVLAEKLKSEGATEATKQVLPLEGLMPATYQVIRIAGPWPIDSLTAYETGLRAFQRISKPQNLFVFEIEQLQLACQDQRGSRDTRFESALYPALQDISLLKLFVDLAATGFIGLTNGQIVLAIPNDIRPVVLHRKGDWLKALTTFTSLDDAWLQQNLAANRRATTVKALREQTYRQSGPFLPSEDPALSFRQLVQDWLRNNTNSSLNQLGLIFEHFLQEE